MGDGTTTTAGEPPRRWEYKPASAEESWPDLPDGLQDRILIAIGQASVCWGDDGVFDAEQAIKVARDLAWQIAHQCIL